MKENYGLSNEYTVVEKENGIVTVQFLHHEDVFTVIPVENGKFLTKFRTNSNLPTTKEKAIEWAANILGMSFAKNSKYRIL